MVFKKTHRKSEKNFMKHQKKQYKILDCNIIQSLKIKRFNKVKFIIYKYKPAY